MDFNSDSLPDLDRSQPAASHTSGPEDIDRARSESLFALRSDISWLDDPSILASRSFALRYTKDKKRNWGNVLQCTHYLEVANWVHNCPELQHIRPIVAAFVGYNHDLGEDFRQDVTPRRIVDECWRGDPALKEYLIDILSKLTDPPELHGKERLRKQIDDAQKMGDLGNYARFADKWCSLKRDL